MEFRPHPYQVDAIRWEISHLYNGLFLPPGLGKTAIILSSFLLLKEHNDVDTLLVVAPLRVCYMVWPEEIKKWDNFNHLTIGILHGTDKDLVLKQLKDVYVINPEGLKWLLAKSGFFNGKKIWIVFDESTLFKSYDSQRFKLLKPILPMFKRRTIMTGTPVPNGLLQLWSQMYLIDMGKRLGKYITHYRLKYFYQKAYDVYNYYLMPGADKLIYAAINDVVMHKSANEINLPPLTFNNINVQLDSITYTIYKEMQEELCVDIGEDDMLYSANQGVNIGKLKQIANGCVYKEDPYNPGKDRIILDLHNEKLNALKDLVEELNGSPLMVIYEYLHDLDKLQRAFPDAPIIGGGTNEKELQKIIIDWNKGNVPVLLLQPKSGGHGLNLQDGGCHDVCWYSITYDLELYVQAIKRVYRQGIKNAVIIHHIVAKGTIDDSIINKLNAKDKVQQLLLEAVEK